MFNLGVAASHWHEAEVAYEAAKIQRYRDLETAREAGFTLVEIAEAFGCTRRGVELMLQRGRAGEGLAIPGEAS